MQLLFVYSDISSVVLLSLNSCCISLWCIYWQSKIRCLLYPCFLATHLISNNNMGLRKGSYFQPACQSHMPIFDLLKPFTRGEPLVDCSIYSTVLYMIGRSKMNERLPAITPYEKSLYFNKSQKNK